MHPSFTSNNEINMPHPGVRSLALGSCLCVLYVGYELARACSLALYASRQAGWSGVFIACGGFALSLASLALYGRGVELVGGVWTLVISAGLCSVVFVACAVGLWALPDDGVAWWIVVGVLFAVREAYVTLVGTQVWALLSAELKEKGAQISRRWFCIFQVDSKCVFLFYRLNHEIYKGA